MPLSKVQKIKAYDPNSIRILNGNLFGLPFTAEESDIIVIPVPWEVTVSYRHGTSRGPEAVLEAAYQVDLFDPDIANAWHSGIFMLPLSDAIVKKNKELGKKAKTCIALLEKGNNNNNASLRKLTKEINEGGRYLNHWLEQESLKWLRKGKLVAVLGGDHSSPLGLVRALAKQHSSFGLLHFDTHADLRKVYEGFEFSHASIMHNISKIPEVEKIVQVGIRDYCEEEVEQMQDKKNNITVFLDRWMQRELFQGKTWNSVCKKIVSELPQKVHISFDIDVFNPSLCPHTGTPVVGGLEWEQAFYLIEQVVRSGRRIIGFDLCEVSPGKNDEWDAIVGARALYRLAILMAHSQKKKRR